MALPKPVESYESVATWRKGLHEQWGEGAGPQPEQLAHLEAFCEFFGKDPDELVAFCFLRKRATGERFGSAKRRQEVAAKLTEFRATAASPTEGRKRQNDVASFLIHNGVLLQMGIR